jgi:lincosamide nucleotidyltransferase A/C/D/E
MMTPVDVVRVLDALDHVGAKVWLDGGWGVDALIEEQTRDHDDLDLVIASESSAPAIAALQRVGYTMAQDDRPMRFVLAAANDRRIDFHPVVFNQDGSAVQKEAGFRGDDAYYPAAGFSGSGAVAGHRVACLTPALLVLHHTGYEPAEKDRHNVRLLCERFGIPLPDAFA